MIRPLQKPGSFLRTSLAFGLCCAVFSSASLGACTPPPEEPRSAESADPPGPAPDVKAESLSSDDAESAPARKRVVFHDLGPGQKMDYMKTTVTPHMAKLFKEFDAKEFGNFGCTTCHGPGAKEGRFHMPSGTLPLNKEIVESHPEFTKFMAEKVVPEMASLLGEEPYDHEKNEGFGCMECHSEKK